MNLQDAIADYLLYIKHEKGLSRLTHLHYQSHLRYFLRWLEENGYPAPTVQDFTTPLLRRFLYALSDKNLRPRAVHSHFHPLRGLSAFLVEHGALSENSTASIALPKKDAAQRLTVSDDEIAALLDAYERIRNARRSALSRACLAVLIYGGLRRQECLDLQTSDVDLSEGSLLVRSGKGSKSRRIFVCPECIAALREWVALRPQDCRHEWLFAWDTNRRIGDEGLAALLEDVKAIAGLAGRQNIKPHSLRHACATRLLRNGANLRDIQAFLGHSSLQVTSVYLHSSEHQLRSIAHLAALLQKKETPDNVIRLPQNRDRRFKRMATG